MSNDQSTKRILVIDDDPTLTKLTESRLRESGYEVASFNDAPQGLEQAIKDRPDLIILDVMMPIVNGYNFCRLLKSEEEHKEIPIIFLTSRAGDEDKKIGKEVGANAYITKPFKMDDLLVAVEQLINQ